VTCLKCSILVTNFQKLPSAGGFPPPAPLNLQYWWPEVPWFGQIVVFEVDYDEIELQNMVMTSFQWRHHQYITEKRQQNNVTKFFQVGPLRIKISGYASGLGLIIWWSLKIRSWSWKSGLGLSFEKIGGLGLLLKILRTKTQVLF